MSRPDYTGRITLQPGAWVGGGLMQRGAAFSDCGAYRYHLFRKWDERPHLVFIMLNPSTADAEADDPTVRRCIAFAQTLGFGGLDVVNLFAFRATDPKRLKAFGWPIGEWNDAWIKSIALANRDAGGKTCCAWGAHAQGLERPASVLKLLADAEIEPHCLEVTRSGQPAHPLYLPRTATLRSLVQYWQDLAA